MSRRLGYYTDLDERGEYNADVRDMDTDETIFEIFSEEDGSVSLIDDGFMHNIDDMDGLLLYLGDLGLATRGDTLTKITH